MANISRYKCKWWENGRCCCCCCLAIYRCPQTEDPLTKRLTPSQSFLRTTASERKGFIRTLFHGSLKKPGFLLLLSCLTFCFLPFPCKHWFIMVGWNYEQVSKQRSFERPSYRSITNPVVSQFSLLSTVPDPCCISKHFHHSPQTPWFYISVCVCVCVCVLRWLERTWDRWDRVFRSPHHCSPVELFCFISFLLSFVLLGMSFVCFVFQFRGVFFFFFCNCSLPSGFLFPLPFL